MLLHRYACRLCLLHIGIGHILYLPFHGFLLLVSQILLLDRRRRHLSGHVRERCCNLLLLLRRAVLHVLDGCRRSRYSSFRRLDHFLGLGLP